MDFDRLSVPLSHLYSLDGEELDFFISSLREGVKGLRRVLSVFELRAPHKDILEWKNSLKSPPKSSFLEQVSQSFEFNLHRFKVPGVEDLDLELFRSSCLSLWAVLNPLPNKRKRLYSSLEQFLTRHDELYTVPEDFFSYRCDSFAVSICSSKIRLSSGDPVPVVASKPGAFYYYVKCVGFNPLDFSPYFKRFSYRFCSSDVSHCFGTFYYIPPYAYKDGKVVRRDDGSPVRIRYRTFFDCVVLYNLCVQLASQNYEFFDEHFDEYINV